MTWSKEAETHINEHLGLLTWPAKGSDIIAQCDNLEHLPEEEKKMFVSEISPDKTYENADEVRNLFMKEPAM